MKKTLFIICSIGILCFSGYIGYHIADTENTQEQENQAQREIIFAMDNIKSLKEGFEADTMNNIICEIYAAHTLTSNTQYSSALHELWNALIFDGEYITGFEDEVISALTEKDAQEIKSVAMDIRLEAKKHR